MKLYLNYPLLLSLLELIQGQVFNASTLKFIYVIARHGSRTPTLTYPLDMYPINDTRYWPEGPGQLTTKGKVQAYNVGVNLRQRYNDFLSPYYRSNETRVLSNLYGRDLMSAELLAAGLYPPVGRQIWNPNLPWQPVPIWPEMYDVVDVTNNLICPRYKALLKKAYENAYDEVFLPYKGFLDLLQNVTGEKFAFNNMHELVHLKSYTSSYTLLKSVAPLEGVGLQGRFGVVGGGV